MAFRRVASIILICATVQGSSAQTSSGGNATVLTTCQSIAEAISSASSVFYPGSSSYTQDISHWSNFSTENAVCSVEPGTAADVGAILRILGKARTPFGVKGGGHSPNIGFSSTTGVEIAMTRLSEVTYHQSSQTVDIGPGLVWDQVYAALEPHNVSVVGGRIAGVGVAGFTLGGGLSYKSNQYGLTIDTVQAYELVLPNGTVTTVTSANTNLWFAIRGGFNNFGIVTKFTLKTFPQTEIWAGTIVIPPSAFDAAVDAIAAFQENVTDPKAAINAAFAYASGQTALELIVFYDAPAPPPGIFDGFLSITGADTSAVKTRTLLDLVLSEASTTPGGPNILLSASPVESFTKPVIQSVINETIFWGKTLTSQSATLVLNVVEVFLPSMFSHGSPSAYPPDRSVTIAPINLYFAWTDAAAVSHIHDAMVQSAAQMKAVTVADGQDVVNAAIYSNYALGDAPLESIYGQNVQRLHEIKEKYDSENVMGLAGGFKF